MARDGLGSWLLFLLPLAAPVRTVDGLALPLGFGDGSRDGFGLFVFDDIAEFSFAVLFCTGTGGLRGGRLEVDVAFEPSFDDSAMVAVFY